jgi:hypothetical protein
LGDKIKLYCFILNYDIIEEGIDEFGVESFLGMTTLFLNLGVGNKYPRDDPKSAVHNGRFPVFKMILATDVIIIVTSTNICTVNSTFLHQIR